MATLAAKAPGILARGDSRPARGAAADKAEEGGARINLHLSPRAAHRVEELREIMDAPSNAEVVRQALRFYDFVVQKQLKGETLCFKDQNGEVTRCAVFV